MPARINMFLSNGNVPQSFVRQSDASSLGANYTIAAPKTPSALNASMLGRVHNVRPGCGSCGRH